MEAFKKFETERLWIRPTSADDASFVFELMNSQKWLQFIGDRNIKTLADAQAYITYKMIPQLKKLGYSNYTVVRKTDKTKIGSCGLYDREGLDGIDIGFAFLPQYEGMGYAFECARRLQRAAHEEFGITQLYAITAKENLTSQRLLKKLQFKLLETISLPSDPKPLILYTLTFNEL